MLKTLGLFFSPDLWKQVDETAAKFHWTLRLRWVALAVQLLSIVPGLYFGFLQQQALSYFLLVLFTMSLVNIFSMLLYSKGREIKHHHLLIQLTFDLIALSALLFLTGGFQNPFASLLLFHAALGPLLLSPKWNVLYFFLLAIVIIALYFAPTPSTALTAHSQSVVLLTTQIIVAFVIWQFTTWLSKTLATFRRHVNQLEQHENRMDRLRAVGALASGFSHEFATPLNVLKLRLGRIRRKLEDLDPSQSDDCTVAGDAIDQCEISLRNLLKAQVDANTYSLQKTPITSFVRRICESWHLAHPDSMISYSDPPQDDHLCLVPQLALSQTILSILDNSWQADPNSSIQIKFSTSDQWISISIVDAGPGIPDTILEKIGEPFLTTKSDGTGLGLYNAYNLLEAIDGKLEVSNVNPNGACVKLIFPLENQA